MTTSSSGTITSGNSDVATGSLVDADCDSSKTIVVGSQLSDDDDETDTNDVTLPDAVVEVWLGILFTELSV